MSDSLLGTLDDNGDLSSSFDITADPNLATAQVDTTGEQTSPSLWDQIVSGVSDAAPAAVAAIKSTGSSVLDEALTGAKNQILSSTTQRLAARSDVQAAARQQASSTIGSWFLSYWKEIALVGLVALFFIVRKIGR